MSHAWVLRARYLNPTGRTMEHSILGWLLQELPDATSLLVASGYVSADILDWLEEPIEGVRNRGGRVQAIVGSNGGHTTAADIERLFGVFGDSLCVDYAEGGIFHPKIYVVEHADRIAAAVGSSNFTPGGAFVNVEASVVLETDDVGPPPEAPLDSILESVDPAKYDHATRIQGPADIERLKALGVIDRIRRSAPSVSTDSAASGQRQRRQIEGFGRREVVSGIPKPTRRRLVVPPAPALPQPSSPGGVLYCGLAFSSNDLKDVGTREISVSSGVRVWAGQVLGRDIAAGEGTLFEMEIHARLAASPGNAFRTPEPVRIWAAGSSGGTHQDVRLVLGNNLRAELDDEANLITGRPIPEGAIGVFELPSDPSSDPVRLTVFLPDDSEFPAVQARLGTLGREQKPHFSYTNRPPELSAWTV